MIQLKPSTVKLLNSAATALYRGLATRHPAWLCRLKLLRNHIIERDHRFWQLYSSAVIEETTVQPLEDFFNLYKLVIQTQNLPGEIAELGVYRGGSAKLIAQLKGDKPLHLFDTFEGMPPTRTDIDVHRAGDFCDTSLDAVKLLLKDFRNVSFHVGFFPDSARGLLVGPPVQFSLVHLDADIYESTKAGLDFFYPRTVKGGVIISHDYRSLPTPGVKKAFDEFFADKPEPVIELWKTQCLVVKQ